MSGNMPGFPVLHYLSLLNSCPLSRWCHPTISSSVTPFPSCPRTFPASGSLLMSQLFSSGGQSVGASTLASALPVNIQGGFPLGLTGLISSLSKGPSKVFSSITVWKHRFFSAQPSLWSNSQICTWLLELFFSLNLILFIYLMIYSQVYFYEMIIFKVEIPSWQREPSYAVGGNIS